MLAESFIKKNCREWNIFLGKGVLVSFYRKIAHQLDLL